MSKTIVFLFSFIFFSTRLLSQNYEVGLTTRRDWIAALKERQARSYWFVVTGQRDDCLTNQVGLAAIRGSCHSRQRRLQLVGQVDRRLPHALYYAIHVALGGAGFQSARMANTSLLIPVARQDGEGLTTGATEDSEVSVIEGQDTPGSVPMRQDDD